MSILVNTQNEQEEKVLLAFLESLRYDYQVGVREEFTSAELDQYNKELDVADAEITQGNYISHSEVEALFEQRRKAI